MLNILYCKNTKTKLYYIEKPPKKGGF